MGSTTRQTRREAGTQSLESRASSSSAEDCPAAEHEPVALPAFPISDPKTDLTLHASTVLSRQAASAHYFNL
jgi:hypothetical protein